MAVETLNIPEGVLADVIRIPEGVLADVIRVIRADIKAAKPKPLWCDEEEEYLAA